MFIIRGQMSRFSRPTAVTGPHGYPLLGIFPQLRRNPLRYLTEAARRYGEVVSLPLGVRRAYLLAYPAHIQHVLQDQPHRYRKGASVARIKPLFGEGLTTSEGALWQRHRQLMQPLFQWQQLLPWTNVIAEATAAMLVRCAPLAAYGQPVDLAAVLRDLTQGIMHQVLFGLDTRPSAQAAGQALMTAVGQLDHHIWAVLPPPLWLPTRHNRQLHQAL
jgi:cytochrome P450